MSRVRRVLIYRLVGVDEPKGNPTDISLVASAAYDMRTGLAGGLNPGLNNCG